MFDGKELRYYKDKVNTLVLLVTVWVSLFVVHLSLTRSHVSCSCWFVSVLKTVFQDSTKETLHIIPVSQMKNVEHVNDVSNKK